MNVALRLDPSTSLVKVWPRKHLGGQAFHAYRACIDGARYVPATKLNVAPLDKVPAILRRLREAGFSIDLDSTLIAALREHEERGRELVRAADDRLDLVDAILRARGLELYGYQREGVRWLSRRTSALVADEMGLGKTIQALVALPSDVPVIVVVPASVKGVWKREVAAWRPDLRVTVLSGRGSFRWPEPGEVVVLNYEILPSEADLAAVGPVPDGFVGVGAAPAGCVAIADEGHMLKNHKAQRSVRWNLVAAACRAVGGCSWVLTATPLLNKPPELWGVLSAAGSAHEVFGTFGNFMKLYNARKDPKWGGVKWGQPENDVPVRLARASLRRLRKDVAQQIPEKRWEEIEVDVKPGVLRACEALCKRLEKAGVDLDRVEAAVARDKLKFDEFSEVRAALAVAKIPAMLEFVEHHEEQEEPLVVFSAHRAPIDQLKGRPGWAVITGDTPQDERTAIEDAFQRGELKGVGATIQAGGVGITLTRSARVLFVDRHWTPALNSQAEDRCCRLGQRRGVLVTTLVAPHKIDRHLARLLTEKTTLAAASLALPALPVEEELDLDQFALESRELVEQEERRARFGREKFRPASGEIEAWAAAAVRTLSNCDPDHAGAVNGVGWNKIDGGIGHSLSDLLTSSGGLTDKQWQLAVRLCKKYHRQVGEAPEVAA